MKKSIMAVGLAVAMSISVVACGSSNTPANQSEEIKTETVENNDIADEINVAVIEESETEETAVNTELTINCYQEMIAALLNHEDYNIIREYVLTHMKEFPLLSKYPSDDPNFKELKENIVNTWLCINIATDSKGTDKWYLEMFDEEGHFWDMGTFTNGEFEATNGTEGVLVNENHYILGEDTIYLLNGYIAMGDWQEYEIRKLQNGFYLFVEKDLDRDYGKIFLMVQYDENGQPKYAVE